MTRTPDRMLRLVSRSSSAEPQFGLDQDREVGLRARIVARDEAALSELITTTSPWLLGVAHGMLQDMDDAEDVVMDVFRSVWISLATDDSGGALGLTPLLLRMTRQRAIDRLRSRGRGVRLVAALTPTSSDAAVAPVEPNEAAQPGWHIHTRVHAALAGLPTDQRTAVELAYFDGLAQSEIASRLGIPLGTVKTRLRLAFGRLRATLAPLKDWVP